jgi:hypothetical protein
MAKKVKTDSPTVESLFEADGELGDAAHSYAEDSSPENAATLRLRAREYAAVAAALENAK